jgi:two-component system, OmpR family, KDP operon response regulator KdpE
MTNAGPLVLAVEDEPQMRRFLRASLTSHGFDFVGVGSAKEAIAEATTRNPEVILLDLGLPDADGVELTRRFREWSHTPIIVISARGREADKIEALDAGADDYLTKPFGAGELMARIRVALRHKRQAAGVTDPVFELGPLRVDFVRRQVIVGGHEVHLTPIEYKLLAVLAQSAGRVLTHTYLLNEVWGSGHTDQAQYLRVYMAQLRRKIESDATRPKLLITEPGVGYRLRDQL